MTRQNKGFIGIAALISMVGFLMLPVVAQASEPAVDQSLSQLDDETQASPAATGGDVDATASEGVEPGSSAESRQAGVPMEAEDQPEPEIQLSMANPFGRTMTMGGRH